MQFLKQKYIISRSINKERWSRYCFVEGITINRWQFRFWGWEKRHSRRGREAANLSLEGWCILPLDFLLWSIEQGGRTKIKREAHSSSLSSFQRAISYLQLGSKRQQTPLGGVLVEQPSSLDVLHGPQSSGKAQDLNGQKKKKQKWVVTVWKKRYSFCFPRLVAKGLGWEENGEVFHAYAVIFGGSRNSLIPLMIIASSLPTSENSFLTQLQPFMSEFSGPSSSCSWGSTLITKGGQEVGRGGEAR